MTFQSLFELEQVSYRYGNGVLAICEVDLCIREGERVAILGATRSGKTTLLKVLQGQVAATAGRVQARHRRGQILTLDIGVPAGRLIAAMARALRVAYPGAVYHVTC